jgi:hypothetical protein
VSVAVVLSLALAVAGAGLARTQARPSTRGCLIAWNASGNRANHLRLLTQKPISGLQLLPGQVATDTWTKGSGSTHTAMPACLLTVAKSGRIRIVAGRWQDTHVSHWTWGRWIPTISHLDPNVRLLSGGRLAKL